MQIETYFLHTEMYMVQDEMYLLWTAAFASTAISKWDREHGTCSHKSYGCCE